VCVNFVITRRRICRADPIAVSKHGRVVGFYIPLERDTGEVERAVSRLADTVDRVVAQTGLSEDELAGLFDVRGGRAP